MKGKRQKSRETKGRERRKTRKDEKENYNFEEVTSSVKFNSGFRVIAAET